MTVATAGAPGPPAGAPAGEHAPRPAARPLAGSGGRPPGWTGGAGPYAKDAVPVAAPAVGALTILAGTTALPSIVLGGSWVLPLVEIVLVILLIGLGSRMIRTPAVVTVLIQAGAMAIALTSLFTASGIGGVLPSASAFREARVLLGGAWQQIRVTVPPAPSTPELAFLIAVSIGLAALMVDFLIAEAKAPALVALPLLCLYSVPASVAGQMLPWYAFAAPAAGYALLLATAGHPGRRMAMRTGVGVAGQGAVIAALAIVAALVAASSLTSVGTTGRLPRTAGQGGSIGLSPFTTLHGDLLQGDPVEVLRVKGLRAPDYLKTVSLTTYNPGQGFSLGDLRSDASNINGPLPGGQEGVGDATVTVTSLAFRDKYLPLFGNTDGVSGLGPDWDYDVALGTAHRANPVNPGVYRMQVKTQLPTPDELSQDTVTPGGTLTDAGPVSASVSETARRVTASADSAFEKALALQRYFTDPANGFRYSLTVPTGSSADALENFLTKKQGYCEQYATAMAVMLRLLGIPTRVGIGFTQGKVQPDGSYLVTSNDAHAWVEVAFDQNGWVRFDPTPLVDGQGGQLGFSQPTSGASATTATSAGGDTVTATARTANPDGERTRTAARTVTTTDAVAGGPSRTVSTSLLSVAAVLGILALVALIIVGPRTVRTRRRNHRLARAASWGLGAASAAWSEIEDTGTDHGIVAVPAESARVLANRLARRAHLDDHDRRTLRALVQAVEHEWYGLPRAGTSAGGSGDTRQPAGSSGLLGSSSGPDDSGAGSRAGAGAGAGSRAGADSRAGGGSPAGGESGAVAVLDGDAARAPDHGSGAGVTGESSAGSTGEGRADLAGAVRAVALGLTRQEPLRGVDRWYPRSLRRH